MALGRKEWIVDAEHDWTIIDKYLHELSYIKIDGITYISLACAIYSSGNGYLSLCLAFTVRGGILKFQLCRKNATNISFVPLIPADFYQFYLWVYLY